MTPASRFTYMSRLAGVILSTYKDLGAEEDWLKVGLIQRLRFIR